MPISYTTITRPTIPVGNWDESGDFWDELEDYWDVGIYEDIDRADFLFFSPQSPFERDYPFQDYVTITRPT